MARDPHPAAPTGPAPLPLRDTGSGTRQRLIRGRRLAVPLIRTLPCPAPPTAAAGPGRPAGPGRAQPDGDVETLVAAAICRSVFPAASSSAIRPPAGCQLRRALARGGGVQPGYPARGPPRRPTARWWPGPLRMPPPPGPVTRPAAGLAAPRPVGGRLVPGIPGEGGQPVHRDQTAVLAGRRPTPGAISAAPAGSSGRGSWLSIPAIIHHPARPIILQEFSHKPGMRGRNDAPSRSARLDHPGGRVYVRSPGARRARLCRSSTSRGAKRTPGSQASGKDDLRAGRIHPRAAWRDCQPIAIRQSIG